MNITCCPCDPLLTKDQCSTSQIKMKENLIWLLQLILFADKFICQWNELPQSDFSVFINDSKFPSFNWKILDHLYHLIWIRKYIFKWKLSFWRFFQLKIPGDRNGIPRNTQEVATLIFLWRVANIAHYRYKYKLQ